MAPLFLFFVFFFPTWGLQNKVLCWTVLQSRIQKASKSSAILICIVVDKKQTTVQNFRFVSRPSNWLILFKKKKKFFCQNISGPDHLGHHLQWPLTRCEAKSGTPNTFTVYSCMCSLLTNNSPLPVPSKRKKKKRAENVYHHWTPVINFVIISNLWYDWLN